jgi:histone-lysine N-methyltransferase SETD8
VWHPGAGARSVAARRKRWAFELPFVLSDASLRPTCAACARRWDHFQAASASNSADVAAAWDAAARLCGPTSLERRVLDELRAGGPHAALVVARDAARGDVVRAGSAGVQAGTPVLEYRGQLLDGAEAARREAAYRVRGLGCYMLYFRFHDDQHCLDATAEDARLGRGRLVSHSRRAPNLHPLRVAVGGVPRVVFVALRDLAPGEELTFDYGDRESVAAFPWLDAS